ncbi:DNA-directed RNA polymerase subunit F [Acidianus sulfidivorans JP7]|uniref:DNA-directed RNA polymerase subunit Rpo4 n=1 Tax=Acidianus sulfidivorans JP7 TaxID=619593 RepID=A0A2U9IMG9_9CREN|nr:RNA polymerase Rpb4 family protein [Acidianus sulfidivorans]AWR97259.1 DNA-directed RNA polymerase subunit F [Acidianus sulfidivorans JP7]
MSSVTIEEEHYIPYSVAKKYILEMIKNGETSSVVQRTYEYLNLVSKCSDSDAIDVLNELKDIINREDIRVIIASICPETSDDVRAILQMDSKNYTDDDVNKILEVVKKHLVKD